MTGAGPAGGDGQGDDGRRRRGDVCHGAAGVQHGNKSVQFSCHEHRTGILSACAVALVCVATVIAVRVGDGPGTGAASTPTGIPTANTAPATAGTDPSVLTGRLVNDGSMLCLRVTGTADGLVPVQDTCTGDDDRIWTLARQDGGGTHTRRPLKVRLDHRAWGHGDAVG
ncbi:hypothetical protein [Streptomyces sp. NPDC091371]|uniref:RICIN domain-containing protein n=1 Tax=Streptomyces sp. NPDC091371 TaxID=3155303 RepID=UPI003434B8C5